MTTTHENVFPGFEQATIDGFSSEAYLAYAYAVVQDRALPDIEDGMKPVQRRILFTMADIKLTHDAKPVKCARIVGDALGKYHPHGDASVYDALVRQAQDFTLRYPLILGQGNFGSRDGDGAAAMRYTEARLSPIAQLLLKEINGGTVDYKPNYDGAFEEPTLLPARLPMMLLNGSAGIAVGMACNIFSHNLGEVANAVSLLLETPDAADEALFEALPGPDFPSGGQLTSTPQEIAKAYSTGNGSLRLRARWKVEELARGQWQVVITELPYQVSTAQIMQELDKLSNPEPPDGKKQLLPKQATLKAATLEFVDSAKDESSSAEPIRLVIHPKTSKVDLNAMVDFLMANTSLESTVSLNLTALDINGKPGRMTLREVILQWIQFRLITIHRRSKTEHQKLTDRVHVLEGRLMVTNSTQKVIDIIQTSDDPKAALMAELGMSEIQATDVLDMRLRALNRLEGDKLKAEHSEASKRIAELNILLTDESALKKLMGEEVTADAKAYGDARRTLLKPESKKAASSTAAIAKAVVDEPLTVVLTKRFAIKAFKGHKVDLSAITLKNGDEVMTSIETRTPWPLFLLASDGRVFTLDAGLLPSGRMDPTSVTTMVELAAGVRPLSVFAAKPDEKLLFATEEGLGLTVKSTSLVSNRKSGKAFLDIAESDSVLQPVRVPNDLHGHVALGSSDGRMLVIPLEEVKERPSGGKGIQLMSLKEGEQQLATAAYVESLEPMCLVYAGDGASPEVWQFGESNWQDFVGKRARAGKALPGKAVFRRVSYDFG